MNLKNSSVIGFIVAVLSLVTLLYRRSLLAEDPIGITIQVLSFMLMVWARITFGKRSFHAAANPTEGGLVTSGPYKFVRHPIYAAVLYFMWTGIVTHLTITHICIGLVGTTGLIVRILAEEQLVRERYPQYAGYAATTKRLVPFII